MENRPVKSGICPILNVKSGMSPEQSEICPESIVVKVKIENRPEFIRSIKREIIFFKVESEIRPFSSEFYPT